MTIDTVETIGFIGAGNIGGNLARLATRRGYTAVLSNSRGPETLRDLVADIGENAHAAVRADAAKAGDVVVVTVPLKDIGDLPAAELDGKVVIDTCNYYPDRDGHIVDLDEERTTTSQMVQAALPRSRVVKAFNHIMADDLVPDARPAGSRRRALVVAGADSRAKELVTALIDDLGYDVVDIGDLSESWRIQRDTPGYTADLDRDDLVTALAAATRPPS